MVHNRVFHECKFLKKQNGKTRCASIWGLVWRNPKGWFQQVSGGSQAISVFTIFSVPRRSRSDVGHSLTVSHTYWRLEWCCSSTWGCWWRRWRNLSIDKSYLISGDKLYLVIKVIKWWKLSGDKSCQVMKVIKWRKLLSDMLLSDTSF